MPARFTQATRFCVEVAAPVTMWTFTSSRAPGHADRRADAVLLVDDEVLRQHVQHLAAGRQRHRARGVERAPHVLARDLAVLAGHGHHAAAVEALDVGAAHGQVRRADLDAGHELGLFDRLLDGVDGGFEVDDDAALQALRLGHADADDVEPAAVGRPRPPPCTPSTCRCRARRCTAHCVPLLTSHPPTRPRRATRAAARRRRVRDARTSARRTAGPPCRWPTRGRAAPCATSR